MLEIESALQRPGLTQQRHHCCSHHAKQLADGGAGGACHQPDTDAFAGEHILVMIQSTAVVQDLLILVRLPSGCGRPAYVYVLRVNF